MVGLLDYFTQNQAPQGQAQPQPQDPNQFGWKDAMGALGYGLLAKMQNQNADIVAPAFKMVADQKAAQRKQAALQQFGTQIQNSNLSPDQKAYAQYVLQSGDDKAIESIAKFITPNQNANKFGAPIGVTDPKTGKLKYVQVNSAGEVRDVPGVAPINRYATAFQKEEANVQNKVLKYNGLDNVDPDSVINAYLDGSLKLEDGTQLKPLSPALYNDFSAYVAKTSNTATISKALRANTAHAEMEAFQPFIKSVQKEYGTTYWGKSPDAFIDSFKNDDVSQKKLGNLIAANVLSNATMNAINSVDFGEAGETAVQRLLDESKAAINTNFPRLSGKARQFAIDALMEQQTKALKVRNQYGVGAAGAIGIPQQQGGGQQQQGAAPPTNLISITNTKTGVTEQVTPEEARRRGVPGV